MLDLSVHKIFTKDLNKAQLNPTNSAKLFLYISLLLNNEELPPQEARVQKTETFEHSFQKHLNSVYTFI